MGSKIFSMKDRRQKIKNLSYSKKEKKGESKMKKAQNFLIVTLVILLLTGCLGQPQPKTYKIGILQMTKILSEVEEGFKAGMAGLGYTEGEKVAYVYRNADGNMDDLDRFAQELVDEKVDLIVSITTPASIIAMKASEGTETPMVFIFVSDPVRAGLVESLGQPGGRVTGIKDGDTETVGKRLELLQRMAPDIQRVLSVYSYEEALLPAEENLREAAAKLGLELVERQVHTTEEARTVFQTAQPGEVDAIFIPSDTVVVEAQEAILGLALRDGLPQIAPTGMSGFLASYSADVHQAGAQGAPLVDKILRGAAPSSLPVEIPREYNLIVELSIAEQIGLTIPDDVLNMANVVLK